MKRIEVVVELARLKPSTVDSKIKKTSKASFATTIKQKDVAHPSTLFRANRGASLHYLSEEIHPKRFL
jgi:hypothetical protein